MAETAYNPFHMAQTQFDKVADYLNLDGATLHYAARFTSGTGRPGTRWNLQQPNTAVFDSGADFILAPEGPLTLRDARVTTHQLSVVIPIQ